MKREDEDANGVSFYLGWGLLLSSRFFFSFFFTLLKTQELVGFVFLVCQFHASNKRLRHI